VSTPLLIELRPGSVLAGYRVEGVVARGGMGALYTARAGAAGTRQRIK
jgi:hypothetical protein